MNKINYDQLLKFASEASQNAYAPYSNFRVGASVLFQDGRIYKGCNVENASYGLTICAERNALSTAVADGNKSKLLAVAIDSPNSKLCYPCGACRQWITEFSPDVEVIVRNSDSSPLIMKISKLLPCSFELVK